MTEEKIKKTFEDIGVKGFRALRRTILCRTEPVAQKTEGGIWLPPKAAAFYGEMPHIKYIEGLILASGPQCEVKPGERIIFQRLHFARWKALPGDVYVGWIDESQIVGYSDNE